MTFLLLGLAVLVVGLLLARGFTRANPTIMARQLRFLGGILSMAIAAVLIVRGQSGLGLMLGFVGWGLLMGRGVLPWGTGGWGGGGSPSPGQGSRIVTDHLDMEMDHETGAIRGQVRKGRYAGRDIEMLAPAELADLWQDYSFADPTSAQVIEAYLDRRHPTWRDDLSRASGGDQDRPGTENRRPASATGRMTRAEAFEILGLEENADAEAVRSAHRDLMKRMHPDCGGSTYLAAKINEAKAVLIGD